VEKNSEVGSQTDNRVSTAIAAQVERNVRHPAAVDLLSDIARRNKTTPAPWSPGPDGLRIKELLHVNRSDLRDVATSSAGFTLLLLVRRSLTGA
jgi:hypothetical protein